MRPGSGIEFCYDGGMKRILFVGLFFLCASARYVGAQSANGALELTARVTPTAAKPEPVRDFTFYVLLKSYGDIVKEIDERDGPPVLLGRLDAERDRSRRNERLPHEIEIARGRIGAILHAHFQHHEART